jgi:cytosine/adenosine deaminase-related metal-dependent hydrolase
MWRKPIALVNGRVWHEHGVGRSIRFSTRILSVDTPPVRGDVVFDLDGSWVLPGLINAHDHLELNHFGLLKFRDVYLNATDWIDDMRPRLRTNPAIASALDHSLADRLLMGGLKNVLSGVTTVAHHNPLYPELRWRFSVNVVRRFGWAHSFALEGQPVGARGELGVRMVDGLRETSADVPFIVHLSEGVDERARAEFDRFEALGGLSRWSVIVHGVAIDDRQWSVVRARGAGIVWCPASNMFLFGRTLDMPARLDGRSPLDARVCLGTDARITGSRDLLDELRVAAGAGTVSPGDLLQMVTSASAAALGLRDAGTLRPGARADLCVVPAGHDSAAEALLAARRADLLLVTVGGRPLVGHPTYAPIFEPRRAVPHPAIVDGEPKILDRSLVRRIVRSSLAEPGLEIARS